MAAGTVNLDLAPELRAYLQGRNYPVDAQIAVSPAGSAGSGRQYFRLTLPDASFVIQQSFAEDPDFARFVQYGGVFAALALPTPQIYAVSSPAFQVLMEDLGATTLLDFATAGGETTPHYRALLTILATWQQATPAAAALLPELTQRRFDFASLRWETEYFTEHFWQGELHLTPDAALHTWFDQLATRVADHPQVLMHRDLQSQNVMLGNPLRWVDFQGARLGSAYYDLASLLWDPYMQIAAPTVTALFDQWCALPRDFSLGADPWQSFLDAACQRLMQALGAFGRLYRQRGLEFFGAQIPRGVQQLCTVLAARPAADWGRTQLLPQLQQAYAN